jgi:predicted nucleotidyltransferase
MRGTGAGCRPGSASRWWRSYVDDITGGTMELDPTFREFIASLLAREVRFLVVGGYAVALHGHPRYTADLDVWVLVDEQNAEAVVQALTDFGLGGMGLSAEDFMEPDRVVQLGYPPLRIDLMTSIDAVDFPEAYERRVEVEVDGVDVPFISLEDLRRNKEATGRAQDLADLEALEE